MCAARILEASGKFISDLADDPRSHLTLMFRQESAGLVRILLSEFTNRPGQRLDYHVIAILDQRSANANGPAHILNSSAPA